MWIYIFEDIYIHMFYKFIRCTPNSFNFKSMYFNNIQTISNIHSLAMMSCFYQSLRSPAASFLKGWVSTIMCWRGGWVRNLCSQNGLLLPQLLLEYLFKEFEHGTRPEKLARGNGTGGLTTFTPHHLMDRGIWISAPNQSSWRAMRLAARTAHSRSKHG